MSMEPTLRNAIATVKRNITNAKYGKIENMAMPIVDYYLRDDEIPVLIRSVNKWLANSDLVFCTQYSDRDVEIVMEVVNECR